MPLLQEKMERERAGRSGIYNSKSLIAADGSQGLFSQYVRRQGFVSYRDLAGETHSYFYHLLLSVSLFTDILSVATEITQSVKLFTRMVNLSVK